MMYVDVILPLPLSALYTYSVPVEMQPQMEIGSRVLVNFGLSKFYVGIAFRLHEEKPDFDNIKEVSMILDNQPLVGKAQLDFWRFIADYYSSSLGDVFRAAVPSALRPQSETEIIPNNENFDESTELSDKELSILNALDGKACSLKSLVKQSDVKNILPGIKTLVDKNLLRTSETLQKSYQPKFEKCVVLSTEFCNSNALSKLFVDLKRAQKQKQMLTAYIDKNTDIGSIDALPVPINLLTNTGSRASLNALIEKKIFVVKNRKINRLASSEKTEEMNLLTEAQQKAFQEIKDCFKTKNTVLLHGVTSSGKTEIYIKLIAEALEEGKQVLYLVPEIGLTTQLAKRIQRIFGNKVGLYHSRFNDAERVEIWNNLRRGNGYQVILGARSAVFLPFERLGLVIVDEEHDASYKQADPAPRYQARNAAIMLASLFGAKTVLGSATPAVETYTNCLMGKYGLVHLNTRFADIELPEIKLVNLPDAYRKHMFNGHFTYPLINAMKDVLARGEQIILFQNRRGYSPYVECQNCGWVAKCPHCDVSLTYHKAFGKLVCHHCGFSMQPPIVCPECGSEHLKENGLGTEKVEDEAKKLFPEARIARMDLDSTRRKHAFESLITAFENGKINILIGTQLVSKGLDFDNVGLVGILNADAIFNYPDFRSYERGFQMLTQVSGRAGRKKRRGLVLIQSSMTDEPIMTQIVDNDYRSFYDNQMIERQMFKYPPYFNIIQIVLKHRQFEVVNYASNWLAKALVNVFGQRILGPEAPVVGRVKNTYVRQIYLKIEVQASATKAKSVIKQKIDILLKNKAFSSVYVYINVDPM